MIKTCFQGKIYFVDEGSQNIFAYQLTFTKLELKVRRSTEYVIVWISKGLYKSKLLPLHGAILTNIKYFLPKIAMQFNNTPLVVEQDNYATEIVNDYIVYNLDNWRKILLRNFRIKNCLFGATTVVKNSDKKITCIVVME